MPETGNVCGYDLTRSRFSRALQNMRSLSFFVGLPGVEPGSHPPQGCILPLYYSPKKAPYFLTGAFFLLKVFKHLTHTKTRFPGTMFRTSFKFARFLWEDVGL